MLSMVILYNKAVIILSCDSINVLVHTARNCLFQNDPMSELVYFIIKCLCLQ